LVLFLVLGELADLPLGSESHQHYVIATSFFPVHASETSLMGATDLNSFHHVD
jgi:hypothetical protein